jgi:orotidine-5'-phosphate decarboxylase
MNLIIPNHERLIVALDVPGIAEAKDLVEKLGDLVSFYKVGLELCMSGNYFELISWLKNKNKKVFADLKLLDIPATVGKAVKNLSKHEIDFLTIHVSDHETMKMAVENKGGMKILAVTVLTSLDKKSLVDIGGDIQISLEELAIKRAELAENNNVDGVIASGLEAEKIRKKLGADFLIVTPGVRSNDEQKFDQKRTVDVVTAFENGANYIVVGRPIILAANPALVANQIQQQISQIFKSKSKMGNL